MNNYLHLPCFILLEYESLHPHLHYSRWGRGSGHILFIIDFLNLNLGAYLIFWAKNTVENVSGPFGAEGGGIFYS